MGDRGLPVDWADASLQAQVAIRELEDKVVSLELVQSTQRRDAELHMQQVEREHSRLAARAVEIECSEMEIGVELASSLPALQEQVKAEERAVKQLLQARESSLSPDEQQYFEWYHMLSEDKPAHVALSLVENTSDDVGKKLRQSLSKTIESIPRQGLDRLEAELSGISGKELRNLSCAQCFTILSESSLRLVFGDTAEAYALVEDLRCRNDIFAGEVTSLRWRRLGLRPTQALSEPVIPSAPSLTGPRFEAPPLFQTSGENDLDAPRPAQLVIADAREWETNAREHPSRSEASALSFLVDSSSRFCPKTASVRFPATWADNDAPLTKSHAWNDTEVAVKKAPTLGLSDLAQITADAFKQPLSQALGGKSQRHRRQASPASLLHRPPRSQWVTFDPPRRSSEAIPLGSESDRLAAGMPPLEASGFDCGQIPLGDGWPDPEGAWSLPPESA